MIRALALLLVAGLGQADAPPLDRATMVAEALLAADQAPNDPAGTEVRRVALRTLERSGASPADGVDDPRPRWRTQSAMRVEPMRGRLLGPAFQHGAIPPRGAWRVGQVFVAGRMATVALASQPRTATLLRIDGPDAGVRCSTASHCTWMPRFTERYTITVSNAAGAPARFFLVTD